jgi:diaminopimelate decarboxylase
MIPEPVRELALTLSSFPAYVYDLGGLSAHVAAIRAALPRPVELYYAVKANPDARVLRTVAAHVDGLEVSSGGERAHACSFGKIAFGGPGKTFADLVSAVRAGTYRFHVESPHEFSSLASAAASAGRVVDVLLRVNLACDVDAALVMGGRPSPFGMDAALLDECEGSEWVRVRGLHAHVASGLDVPGLLASARELLSFGRPWCHSRGVREPEFNLGGGMAVDYGLGSVFDWARAGRPGVAGRDVADRAGARGHRVLRLVPDPRARCETEPRRGFRGHRGRDPSPADAGRQGARPAVDGQSGFFVAV